MRTEEQKAIARERARAWYAANKERVLANVHAYAAVNKDKISARAKVYQNKHKEEQRAYKKVYYQARREELIAKQIARDAPKREDLKQYKKEWRKKNLPSIVAKKKVYHESHRAEIAAHHKAYYAARAQFIKGRVRAYANANKEKVRVTQKRCSKEYRATHRIELLEKGHRRRALIRQLKAEKIDFKKILKEANGQCGICKKPLDLFGYHFDHKIPIARGGSHTADNIQVTHAWCNLSKGARTPEEMVS